MVEPITVFQFGDDRCHVEARGKFEGKDAADYVPSPESEQLYVDLPLYGGPLDLLLHLIKKHSVDIFDIPIVLITQKYLEALDEIRNFNLDLAGEFLLMAATLAEIKSRMLLPPDEQALIDGEEDGVDPRAELVKRLLEYQKFKAAAGALKEMGQLGSDVFFRVPDGESFVISDAALGVYDEPTPLAPVEVFELITLFAQVIEKAKPRIAHSVTMERISIRARINELIEFSRLRTTFHFSDAMHFFGSETKFDIILTFLALLEMARMKLLHITQQPGEVDILLTANGDNLWVSETEMLADLDDDRLPN